MQSGGEILTYVKQIVRETSTSLDTVLLAWLNKNLVQRTRGRGYAQLLVEATTFTTTAGTVNYAVPANFFKLVPNSVKYGIQAQGYYSLLPDVDMSAAEAWMMSGTGSDPQVCILVAGGTNSPTRQLQLLPPFSNSGQVCTYDYYAYASTFTSTASTMQVPELAEVLAYDVAADYAIYHKRFDEAEDYRKQAKGLYQQANRSLIP
jgi:hypothetical protein